MWCSPFPVPLDPLKNPASPSAGVVGANAFVDLLPSGVRAKAESPERFARTLAAMEETHSLACAGEVARMR